jgi:hypothetical protein
MNAHTGSGDTAPFILDLGMRWRSVVKFTPRPLYPWKTTHCEEGSMGRFREEKNNVPLPGLEPRPFSPSLVAITTTPPRFLRKKQIQRK